MTWTRPRRPTCDEQALMDRYGPNTDIRWFTWDGKRHAYVLVNGRNYRATGYQPLCACAEKPIPYDQVDDAAAPICPDCWNSSMWIRNRRAPHSNP